MVVAFALYRVLLHDRTDGNIPLVIYHAAISISMILVIGVDREMVGWLLPAAWIVGTMPLFVFPALACWWRPAGALTRS